MTIVIEESPTVYNVECRACGQVLHPTPKSSLWWRAKQRSEKGLLDALTCAGEDCGCVAKQRQPDAPFRVTGYDEECRDFDIPCNTFVEAVQGYRSSNLFGVASITGVSEKVKERLFFT